LLLSGSHLYVRFRVDKDCRCGHFVLVARLQRLCADHNQGKGSASYEEWLQFHVRQEAGGADIVPGQAELEAAIARGDKYKALAASAGLKVSGAADSAKASE
jgi:hypothetical protein